METYIIQSSDNKQFTLTIQQINQFPYLKDTLGDIEVQPGTILDIPFPLDLLTIVFYNHYHQPLGLDKLVMLINLVAHLGLEDKVHKLLLNLVSYFQGKYTATQIEMFRNTMSQLQVFLVQLFLDKLIGVDYSSTYQTDVHYIHNPMTKVVRTSANLNHVLVRYKSLTSESFGGSTAIFSLWNRNKISIPEIYHLTEIYDDCVREVEVLGRYEYGKEDYVDKNTIYISNDGKYHDLEKRVEGDVTTYDIVPLSAKKQLMGDIMESYYEQDNKISYDEQVMDSISDDPILDSINITGRNPINGQISIDGSKYMYMYRFHSEENVIMGSFAEPDKRVTFAEPDKRISFDEPNEPYKRISPKVEHKLYDSSPLFDTVVTKYNDSFSCVAFNCIDYPQVKTTITGYATCGMKVSYDGKLILVLETINRMYVFTASGNVVVKRKIPDGETIMAITNKYMITYHKTSDELHLWSVNDLLDAITPTIRLKPPNSKKNPTKISNVKVILGENDTFLFIREITYGTDDNKERVLEGTKYKTGVYDTVDQFLDSLVE